MTKNGLYRHFKGNKYLVTGRAIDASAGAATGETDRYMVIYVSLVNGKTFVREEKEFGELIDMRTGKLLDSTYNGGPIVNRFKLLEG